MVSLTLRGNAYIQKVMANNGTILQLIPLLPDYMKVSGTSNNLVYEYRPPLENITRLFSPDKILHIKALPKNGILGISPIDKMMEAVGIATAAEKFGGAFFANGVTPSGVFSHPNALSQTAYDRLKTDFNQKQSDMGNKHKTMILEEGTQWTPMGLTNEQAQFIQTRKFTKEDICTWFGVPPHLIGASDRQPGSSIEQLSLEFLTHSLRPWLVRIERSVFTQCIDEKDWSNYSLEFLTDELLRADTKTRFETHAIALNNGIKDIDEVREIENLNPLENNLGQDHYRPLNMYALGKEPPPQGSNVEKPGAATTTDGSSGYSAGTPAAQGKVPDGTGQGDRSLLSEYNPSIGEKFGALLFPVISNTLDRIERRAKKILESGKGDWQKFNQDSFRDLDPLNQTIGNIFDLNFDHLHFKKVIVECAREKKVLAPIYLDYIDQLLKTQKDMQHGT